MPNTFSYHGPMISFNGMYLGMLPCGLDLRWNKPGVPTFFKQRPVRCPPDCWGGRPPTSCHRAAAHPLQPRTTTMCAPCACTPAATSACMPTTTHLPATAVPACTMPAHTTISSSLPPPQGDCSEQLAGITRSGLEVVAAAWMGCLSPDPLLGI